LILDSKTKKIGFKNQCLAGHWSEFNVLVLLKGQNETFLTNKIGNTKNTRKLKAVKAHHYFYDYLKKQSEGNFNNIKRTFLKICLLILSLFTESCSSSQKVSDFGYDLAQESASYSLNKELKEISGLTFIGKNEIYCVQDEDGIVFRYNLKKEKVDKKIDFAKDSDYEGIAVVGEELYVLKSNGTLYKIKNYTKSKKPKVAKITTFLDSSCDAEGLCYDEESGRLLIACKGNQGSNKGLSMKKLIYSFDLTAQTLQEKPLFVISVKKVQRLKKQGVSQKAYDEFLSSVGKNNSTFNPSGIAIHPLTKEIYLVSAVGNTLLILSKKGKPKHAEHLDGKMFKQPEGIAFDEKGTMYISNEGRGGKANIKSFIYKSKK
jgi:uncharacterized protein YjiK